MPTPTYMAGHALSVVARALIPLVGVIFLDWSAAKLLIAYFADTAAAYYALLAVIAVRRTPSAATAGTAAETRANVARTAIRAIFLPVPTLLLVGFFFGILPLFVMVDLQDVNWHDLLADARLWQAVGLQFALALGLVVRRLLDPRAMASAEAGRALQTVCIASRWMAMLFIGFFLAPYVPRLVYAPLLIATYAGFSIALELAPGRVASWAMRIAGRPVAPPGRHRP